MSHGPNVGRWSSHNEATDITGIPHGPWIPTARHGSLYKSSMWDVRCKHCGFVPPKPMFKQNLLRALKNEQEFCVHCPKEILCPSK